MGDSRRTGRFRVWTAVVCLGFSSGLPLALTGDTLAAWLTDRGLSLGAIGAFGLVGLPYAFKFVWAPLLDRFAPPFAGRLGRRRGWIVAAQAVLALAVLAVGATGTTASLGFLAAAAFAVAFASATQDVVIDAWRAETFTGDDAGPSASLHVTGYRAGMLVSGAGALALREAGWAWPAAYVACGALLALGVVGVALAPAPPASAPPATLQDAVVRPFADFLARRRAVLVLLFIVVFKLPDVVAGSMTITFLKQTGFADGVIAGLRQGAGLVVTIAGTLVGGWLASRTGLRRALVLYGVLQAVSNLAFWGLALAGPDVRALAGAVLVENFCGGLVTAGFLAFLQRQCSPGFAGTQFALLTSLMVVPARVLGGPAGLLAAEVGWPAFFAGTAVLGLPGLLLLRWVGAPAAPAADAPRPPEDAAAGPGALAPA